MFMKLKSVTGHLTFSKTSGVALRALGACEGEPAVPSTRRPDLPDVTPMKSQEVTIGPHHIRVQRRASLRLRLLCVFSVVVLMGVSSALAQYPSGPQISKDGTPLLLQDYASVPLSSLTTGAYPPPIDFN